MLSNTIGINNNMTTSNSQDTSAGKANNEKSMVKEAGKAIAQTLFSRMPDSAGKDLIQIAASILAK